MKRNFLRPPGARPGGGFIPEVHEIRHQAGAHVQQQDLRRQAAYGCGGCHEKQKEARVDDIEITVVALDFPGQPLARPCHPHGARATLLVGGQGEFDQLVDCGWLTAIAKSADVHEHLFGAGAGGDEIVAFFFVPVGDFSFRAHGGIFSRGIAARILLGSA